MMFNLYVKNTLAEALENTTYDIKVNRYPLNNNADGKAVTTDNEQDMQLLLNKINNVEKCMA